MGGAACSSKDPGPCHANVDCAGTKACVQGECIADVAKCESIGAFEDLYEGLPTKMDSISELHTAVDANGAVHYCAYGTTSSNPSAWYGKQTAYNAFTSSEMMSESGNPIRCGAIAIASSGVPYAVNRGRASIVYKMAGGGSWNEITLEGLQGVEGQGAVSGDRALISLTPDVDGGVYLAMSLGYQLEAQGIYLAHVTPGDVEVIENGWDEGGSHTFSGHAPQFVVSRDFVEYEGPDIRYVYGRVMSFNVLLGNPSGGIIDDTEGIHPRGASGPDGSMLAMYLDHNYQLHLDYVDDETFEELAILGEVEIDESGDGQVPWELAVDDLDVAHLLIEDEAQGNDALTYRVVAPDGTSTDPIVMTSNLADLPGMQRYALGTDICGRATIVTAEESAEGLGVVLKVREGR